MTCFNYYIPSSSPTPKLPPIPEDNEALGRLISFSGIQPFNCSTVTSSASASFSSVAFRNLAPERSIRCSED